MQTLVTKLVTAAATAAAALAARRAAEFGWRLARGEDPPTGGASDDRELRDLMLWSALITVAVVLARKVARARTEDLLGGEAG